MHLYDRINITLVVQPEMFTCPEILMNTNRLPLGDLQEDRGRVDHVRLPPWARGDAFEFIRLHREALESDYVSEVSTDVTLN